MFASFDAIREGCKEYLISSNKNSKSSFEQYFPKIRETLIPYLEDRYKQVNWVAVDDFLSRSVSSPDIVNSAVIDIKRIYDNRGSVSKAALDNFIIAFRQFFDYLTNVGIENHNIIMFFSKNPQRNKEMKNLRSQIKTELNRIGISLDKAKKDPPLAENENDDKFRYLLDAISQIGWDSLNLTKQQSLYKLHYIIMIKLFLLLGVKPQRLYDIKIEDYNEAYGQLVISGTDYCIQLPNELSDQMSKIKKFRREQGCSNKDNLLATTNGSTIAERHLHTYLNTIKEQFIAKHEKELSEYPDGANPFTQTGLQKYGIIQMIRQGINPAIIYDVTGINTEIYADCQEKALSDMNREAKSRYFNSNLRAISSFDRF